MSPSSSVVSGGYAVDVLGRGDGCGTVGTVPISGNVGLATRVAFVVGIDESPTVLAAPAAPVVRLWTLYSYQLL
jgi:hypothetical protein